MRTIHGIELDSFTLAYLECALWSSMDFSDESGGQPLDQNYSFEDIAPEALQTMANDCKAFQEANAELLTGLESGQSGHDFWLTRNGHGAGFWDRGLGEVGDKLTQACKAFGGCDLYVGDDGKIYC